MRSDSSRMLNCSGLGCVVWLGATSMLFNNRQGLSEGGPTTKILRETITCSHVDLVIGGRATSVAGFPFTAVRLLDIGLNL